MYECAVRQQAGLQTSLILIHEKLAYVLLVDTYGPCKLPEKCYQQLVVPRGSPLEVGCLPDDCTCGNPLWKKTYTCRQAKHVKKSVQ